MTDDVTPPSRLWQPAPVRALGSAVCAAGVIVLMTQVRWGENLDARMAASMGAHARWWMRHIDVATVPLMCLVGLIAVAGAIIHTLHGCWRLGLRAVILVAATQTSVEVLKHVIHREDGAPNTTPSGHSSLALSLALAVMMVWPQKVIHRTVLAIAAFVAYGTVIGGWHTPGDVVAACAITGFWSSLARGGGTRGADISGRSMAITVGVLTAGTGLHTAQVQLRYCLLGVLVVWASLLALVNEGQFSTSSRRDTCGDQGGEETGD